MADPLHVADINAETLIPFNQGTWTMEEFFHHHNVLDVRVVWNRMAVIERFNFNDRMRGAIGIHGPPGYQISIRVKEFNCAYLLNLQEICPWEVVLANIEARVHTPRTSFCLKMTGNRCYRGLTLGSHESWLEVLQASRALAMAGDGPAYVKIQLDYVNPNTQISISIWHTT